MASNVPAPEGVQIHEPPTAGAWGEWNPTEDSVRPVRGRHRVARQHGGLARSSTVLGVGLFAAVGAGGIATAQDRPQVAISLPDLGGLPTLLSGGDTGAAAGGTVRTADAAGTAGRTGIIPQQDDQRADPGEALRNRILQQAETQQDAAVAQAVAQTAREAQEAAAQEAKAKREEALRQAEEAKAQAEAKAAQEAQAAEAEKAKAEKAEAEKGGAGQGQAGQEQTTAPASGKYFLPTSAYTLTSHYGVSGSMWSSGKHTGLDFAAPTGTPVKAVGAGKVISAGWSGAYGYRIVLQLQDGTEIWYCHLSSMSVTSGPVGAGETIGRVGATGNVTGSHLHLEVRKGGSTVNPLTWLTSKGLNV